MGSDIFGSVAEKINCPKDLLRRSILLLSIIRVMAWRSSSFTQHGLIQNMVNEGILSAPTVIQAMKSVDRANFIAFNPYQDSPQPIGYGQTISAPHMHAYALQLLLPNIEVTIQLSNVAKNLIEK